MTQQKPTASPGQNLVSQTDRFKALARDLEADEDEARWDERLAKVVAHKPTPEPKADEN